MTLDLFNSFTLTVTPQSVLGSIQMAMFSACVLRNDNVFTSLRVDVLKIKTEISPQVSVSEPTGQYAAYFSNEISFNQIPISRVIFKNGKTKSNKLKNMKISY